MQIAGHTATLDKRDYRVDSDDRGAVEIIAVRVGHRTMGTEASSRLKRTIAAFRLVHWTMRPVSVTIKSMRTTNAGDGVTDHATSRRRHCAAMTFHVIRSS